MINLILSFYIAMIFYADINHNDVADPTEYRFANLPITIEYESSSGDAVYLLQDVTANNGTYFLTLAKGEYKVIAGDCSEFYFTIESDNVSYLYFFDTKFCNFLPIIAE